jgi:hypothetical protein
LAFSSQPGERRESAAQAITSAKDSFTSGSYDTARTKASDGNNLANQALNLSLTLKEELGKGFQLPGLPDLGALLPFFIIAAVVLIIAGIIIYRKKTHWDELG